MLEQKNIVIGEQKYTIQQLPAMSGLEVMIATGKILQGASAGFSDEFVLNVSDTQINVAKLVAGILDATDVKGTPQFIKKLILDSVIRPDPFGDDEFDSHFSANYTGLFELLEAIYLHNKFGELVKKTLSPLIVGLFFNQNSQTESTP